MRSPQRALPEITADIVERLRQRRPRVHCITNPVAQTFTANVLLALGAAPSMTVSPKEVVPFARRCDALLVNLGMFDVERQKAALAVIPVLAAPQSADLAEIIASHAMAVFAAAGFAGGFVYWLLAGARA